MARTGEHAVVLGASLGGLAAAAAVASRFDRVTIVERDALPEDATQRRSDAMTRNALSRQPWRTRDHVGSAISQPLAQVLEGAGRRGSAAPPRPRRARDQVSRSWRMANIAAAARLETPILV